VRPEFSHWHPVLASRELGEHPVGVRLLDRQVVVFRTESGRVGALEDMCPHRRMRLSRGRVSGEQLVCQYHGWRFGCDGAGRSPASPKLTACALHFETVERHGAVWIRHPDAATSFPAFDVDHLVAIPVIECIIEAPLAVVLDNFIEVEHTGMTHDLLGYDPARMASVQTSVETSDAAVRVFNVGPQKELPWYTRRLFGLEPTDEFIDEWETRFSPVYTVYDHWWRDALTKARRPKMLRTYVFFNPIEVGSTHLFAFTYATPHWLNKIGLGALLRWYTRALVDREMQLDKTMLEGLADKSESLKGMSLSRFDRPLGEARRRIDRIYRNGHEQGSAEVPPHDRGPGASQER
jgi:phenylpropionate dioxygenase-like ring-hydroxylating dioxygenase large terminal subunit